MGIEPTSEAWENYFRRWNGGTCLRFLPLKWKITENEATRRVGFSRIQDFRGRSGILFHIPIPISTREDPLARRIFLAAAAAALWPAAHSSTRAALPV
jgi:hypothetical protein